MEGSEPGWTLLWGIWIIFFVIVEAAAIYDKDPGDTLSEHVWRLFRVRHDGRRIGVWRRRVLFLFVAWLAAHLLSGGWV